MLMKKVQGVDWTRHALRFVIKDLKTFGMQTRLASVTICPATQPYPKKSCLFARKRKRAQRYLSVSTKQERKISQ